MHAPGLSRFSPNRALIRRPGCLQSLLIWWGGTVKSRMRSITSITNDRRRRSFTSGKWRGKHNLTGGADFATCGARPTLCQHRLSRSPIFTSIFRGWCPDSEYTPPSSSFPRGGGTCHHSRSMPRDPTKTNSSRLSVPGTHRRHSSNHLNS
jgi:hypothetical protein